MATPDLDDTDPDKHDGSDATLPPQPRLVLSTWRKRVLIVIWTLAQFMDAFGGSALFPAISAMQKDLSISQADVVWIFAAYSATFAAFLLISGRVSDVYSSSES